MQGLHYRYLPLMQGSWHASPSSPQTRRTMPPATARTGLVLNLLSDLHPLDLQRLLLRSLRRRRCSCRAIVWAALTRLRRSFLEMLGSENTERSMNRRRSSRQERDRIRHESRQRSQRALEVQHPARLTMLRQNLNFQVRLWFSP